MFSSPFSGAEQPQFVALVSFCAVNTLTMATFKLLKLYYRTLSWEEMPRASLLSQCKLAVAHSGEFPLLDSLVPVHGSSLFLWFMFLF